MQLYKLPHLLLSVCFSCFLQTMLFSQGIENQEAILLQKIKIPSDFLVTDKGLSFGGDIRIGDLDNDGKLEFVIYRAISSVDGGAVQPCFVGAIDFEGNILWQEGEGGKQPNRPGPVAIHDLNADGKNEVICLFVEDSTNISPHSMKNVQLLLFDGESGEIIKSEKPEIFEKAKGEGANWVHQRILIANLSGNATPQDFIIKLGKTIYAFNHEFELLWTYFNGNDQYQNCPAYIPAVGDIDNDGRDEVNGGYYLLDDDGKVMWEEKLGKNMDCVAIDYWDNDKQKRAICSGHGFVMDEKGDTLLSLGEALVPHGQELRVADFDPDHEGREMMIRYNGHKPDIRVVNQQGRVIHEFQLNFSPNHTGMEAVLWNGKNKPALLYNGGSLWSGKGELVCELPGLPQPPVGSKRQGWYHCITCDITGDDGEEIVIYNPWGNEIFIYTPNREKWDQPKKFKPTAKQYNPRLMD